MVVKKSRPDSGANGCTTTNLLCLLLCLFVISICEITSKLFFLTFLWKSSKAVEEDQKLVFVPFVQLFFIKNLNSTMQMRMPFDIKVNGIKRWSKSWFSCQILTFFAKNRLWRQKNHDAYTLFTVVTTLPFFHIETFRLN